MCAHVCVCVCVCVRARARARMCVYACVTHKNVLVVDTSGMVL